VTDRSTAAEPASIGHLVVVVEQFWHRQPGGTAVATERTLEALAELGQVQITGLAARHSPPDREDEQRWQRMPTGSTLRFLRLPRPVLYDSWLRLGAPSIDGETEPDSVVWAASMIVPPTARPVVTTVHDLDFLRHPDRSSRRGRSFFPLAWRRAGERSAVLVCPSSAVAAECVERGVAADRVRVVPWGVTAPLVSETEAVERLAALGIDPGYILWVGPWSARKNAARSGRALRSVDQPVVAVTSGGDRGDEAAPWLEMGERVRRLEAVEPETLSALYRGARTLLYPSLAEGFGLPILEAMAHGVPVVTSFSGATAEVAGGAAVVVDPGHDADIAEGLRAACRDEQLRSKLIADGLVRAGQLSWKNTAAGYAEAFRSVR
jgi:glycosyltransferase involved in cell wall biosynthesis